MKAITIKNDRYQRELTGYTKPLILLILASHGKQRSSSHLYISCSWLTAVIDGWR